MKATWLKWFAGVVISLGIVILPSNQSGAGPGEKKITICHKGQTLELPEPAIQVHLNHGDTLGPCNVTPSQNR
jgi:hypothetical protein